MVKHTQATRRQQLTNRLSVLHHFGGLVFKGFERSWIKTNKLSKAFPENIYYGCIY